MRFLGLKKSPGRKGYFFKVRVDQKKRIGGKNPSKRALLSIWSKKAYSLDGNKEFGNLTRKKHKTNLERDKRRMNGRWQELVILR